ncbi:MAG: hypothetical protein DWQ37_08285 [Planctomycetota bacterium]|nr:MAG: hypothetical protein DWQ37_08285 [Planctomycetota bacterium]
MKSSLPILVCLAAIACGQAVRAQPAAAQSAPGAQGANASVPGGDALIEQVVRSVAAAPSISAKLRHRVELLDRTLLGTGVYLQQGRGDERKFRLEMELRTVLFATQVQHVCDGSRLWTLEELDGNRDLGTVDLVRLRRGQPSSKGQPPSPTMWLSLGGLPRLLVHLQEAFVFDKVVESNLDDLCVLSVEGKWTRGKLAAWLPDQRQAIEKGEQPNLGPLTPNVPHRVVLHVGCDDRFPYRIEYWGPADGQGGAEKLMVVLELYEVQIDAPVDPAQFVFQPPEGVTPRDRTDEYMRRFGVEDPPISEATRRRRFRR